MKVAFVNPPAWIGQDANGWTAMVRSGSRWPFSLRTSNAPDHLRSIEYIPYPVFLGFAATYLDATGTAEVIFRDSIARRESYQSFYQYLEVHKPDAVVFESATPSWDHDANVISEIVKRLRGVKVIVTGPIAASRAEEILEHHPVYAVVKGEYEKGVVKAVNGQSGIIDFDFLGEEEMNRLIGRTPGPWMDYDHWNLYFDANPLGSKHPQLQTWTSRGCWAKCCFCVWPAAMTSNDPDGTHKRAVRYYHKEYLLAYLSEVTRKFPFKSIYFDDDVFNLGDKHVLEVCEVMHKIGLSWTAMCRADGIKRETWRAMKDANCVGVKVGIESGSQVLMDTVINKRLNLEEARETIIYLKSIGLTVHATFMLGLPGETKEQMAETLRYKDSLPIDTCQISGTATLDGTPLAKLVQVGSLAKYPGAKIDENFVNESDGAKRLAGITKGLVK